MQKLAHKFGPIAYGQPTPGTSSGRGLLIEWQGSDEPATGAEIEDVVEALIERLNHLAGTRQDCQEYRTVASHMMFSRNYLNARYARVQSELAQTARNSGLPQTNNARPYEGPRDLVGPPMRSSHPTS